jgi:hypothetical protein
VLALVRPLRPLRHPRVDALTRAKDFGLRLGNAAVESAI